MSYHPKVDDYVKWTNSLGHVTEGWVYFVHPSYITIEVGVKDKPDNLVHFHKKTHCCVLCFSQNWNELEYIKNRRNVEKLVSEYKSQQYRDADLYS